MDRIATAAAMLANSQRRAGREAEATAWFKRNKAVFAMCGMRDGIVAKPRLEAPAAARARSRVEGIRAGGARSRTAGRTGSHRDSGDGSRGGRQIRCTQAGANPSVA